MSFCCRLRDWLQKQKKKNPNFPSNSFLIDEYNPIPFEKMLRRYAPMQPRKPKSQISQSKQPKEKKEESQQQQPAENVLHIQNQNEKFPSLMFWDEQNLQFPFQNNFLEESEQIIIHDDAVKIASKQSEKQNGELDIQPQNAQQDENNKENMRFSENIIQNEEKRQKVPHVKTKISVRMLNKAIKRGSTLKKIANEIVNRRKIELDGSVCSPGNQVIYEAILAFLQQEFQRNPSE